MTWIRSDDDIWDHHKLDRLQERLAQLFPGMEYEELRCLLVGQLHSLWHFVSRSAWEDANLEKWGDLGIERKARWRRKPGALISALRESGFVDGYVVHGWMNRAGDWARKRLIMERNKNVMSGQTPDKLRTNSGQTPESGEHIRHGTVQYNKKILPTASAEFELFWNNYPRRTGKGAALKAWCRLKPGKDLVGKIMAALEAQKQMKQWRADGGKFIPYPATWLNQARWDDDVPRPQDEYV